VVRFNPFAAYAEQGLVRIVRGAWTEEWFRELESFPNSAHDDQCDSTSLAFSKLTLGGVDWDDLYPPASDAEQQGAAA
jgi:predicted phage terminase large subunit-like protein